MNTINLIGTLTKDFKDPFTKYGIDFYELTVSSKRTSGIVDDITVITPKRKHLFEGDRVLIIGNLQTDSYKTEDGSKHLKVYVYTDDVYIATTDNDTNDVQIEGTLTKSSGVRYTPSGRVIGDFVIALDGFFSSHYYIPVIAWGRTANELSKCKIGDKLSVSGRLQSRKYTKESEEFVVLELSVERFETIS